MFPLLEAKTLAEPVPSKGSGGESTSFPFAPARGCLHSLAHGPCLTLQGAWLQPLLLLSYPLHSLSPTLPPPSDEDPGITLVPLPHSRVISFSQNPLLHPICKVALTL